MKRPLGCHAMSVTPVRFDTCRGLPPPAGMTCKAPPDNDAIVELSGDHRAVGGGPGSFVSRRIPVPSALMRHKCATRRLAGQSGVDNMKMMVRPSGESCGSPTRGMLSRSTSVMGRLAWVWTVPLEMNAIHDTISAIEKAIGRGMELPRV